jgi:hypothetical protein
VKATFPVTSQTWRHLPHHRRLAVAVATSLLAMSFVLVHAPLAKAQQAPAPSRPFEVTFQVELCEDGQFPISKQPCEGEVRPGGNSDVRIVIQVPEGAPMLTGGYLRSTGILVSPGTSGPNYDKVGEGSIQIGVVGIGTVGLLVCLVNKNPPDPGDTATVLAVANLSTTTPCKPEGATAIIPIRIKGSGDQFEYTLDLQAAAQAGGAASSVQLTTPVDAQLVFYGMSKPNEDVSPPTEGGVPTMKFSDEAGTYQFLGHFEGGGTSVDRQIPYDLVAPAPPKKSNPWVPIGIAAIVVVIVAVVAWVIFSRRPRYEEEEWEYYEEDVYYEEDQYV